MVATSNKARKLLDLDLRWRDVQHITWGCWMISIVVHCLYWLSSEYHIWRRMTCRFMLNKSGLCGCFRIGVVLCADNNLLWPRKHWSWSENAICKCLPYSLICRNKDIQSQKRNEQDLYVYFMFLHIYIYACSSSSNLNFRDSMFLWSVQENAILYQSSSVIQLYKCD